MLPVSYEVGNGIPDLDKQLNYLDYYFFCFHLYDEQLLFLAKVSLMHSQQF